MSTLRLIRALAALYTVGIGALVYCAHISYERGGLLYPGLFLGLAVLFGSAVGALAYLNEELRDAQARLERQARPPGRRASAEEGVVRVALAAACYEMWWTSAGAEHDRQCVRRGQTT